MLERDNYYFYDTTNLVKTTGIEHRATQEYVKAALQQAFPNEHFAEIHVSYNDSGQYQAKAGIVDRFFGAGKPITNLPAYYEVEVIYYTGNFKEQLIVWSPVKWNDRFAGTAGGGIGIGGRTYLTAPNNTQRGWTVPMAVLNGFTAATINAGNIQGWNDYTLDKQTGHFNQELYENWRIRSTHHMTVWGKKIAEILHNRPIKYSYMNGGSGGGRQSLMEVQNYPHDYDGVWASCPAINWHHFIMGGYWAEVVMNEYHHFLNSEKNQYFLEAAQQENGGAETYYHLEEFKEFDARRYIGDKTKHGIITELDAIVMNEILAGPKMADGSFLWYGFRPGVKNWNKIIPIGTYYYPLIGKRAKPFPLGPIYLKWITRNPKERFEKLNKQQFSELYKMGLTMYKDNLGDNPCIDEFVNAGGKLMIDHGIDDPLIPVDGTLDYYQHLKEHFKTKDRLDEFLRLYITPGDSHGNCWGNGPGIPVNEGMKALINWVEKKEAPEEIRKIRVNSKTGELLEEGKQRPYRK